MLLQPAWAGEAFTHGVAFLHCDGTFARLRLACMVCSHEAGFVIVQGYAKTARPRMVNNTRLRQLPNSFRTNLVEIQLTTPEGESDDDEEEEEDVTSSAKKKRRQSSRTVLRGVTAEQDPDRRESMEGGAPGREEEKQPDRHQGCHRE